MKKKLCGFLIVVVFLFSSCSKKILELPPATQTGANTFGCKVDGELWAPQGFGIVSTAPILEARFMPGRDLIINARNFSHSPTETEFEILIKGVTTPGTYLLNTTTSIYPNTTASYGYYVKRKVNPLNEWMTSEQYTGVVNITLCDTINHIVSGTFEFTAINLYNSPEALNVTDGRFDVKTE